MTVFLFTLVATSCNSGKPVEAADSPPPVPVIKVEPRTLSSNLEIASEFQPYQEIDVYAKVSGYVKKLYVDWGSHVKQGQLLAQLEIPELEQQITQDEASYKRSQQELERAKADLQQARSTHAVSHITYSRLDQVQKTRPGLVSQEEVDIAQGKDAESEAAVSAAKNELAAAEQAVAASKAAEDKDRTLFAYSRITAPFDGIVTALYAYTGALLPAGISSDKGDLALCRLSQNDVLRLVIPLPERAISSVHVGEKIAVNVSTINKTIEGSIFSFSDEIDKDTRTMHTEVHVKNPDYQLVPGMYASVEIPLQTVTGALAIPIQAVLPAGQNKGTVLVVDEQNRLRRQEVGLGLQTARLVEVVSGLKQNQMVVFGEVSQYQPGQAVTPKLMAPNAE
ncbi:MAG TPA: efflux RND transporter periplasmic adaptor subunit [Terriglobales bacterium]|nr:efflux RND transporter periplasmic adaptor subunit [Terriglobales bacterium]